MNRGSFEIFGKIGGTTIVGGDRPHDPRSHNEEREQTRDWERKNREVRRRSRWRRLGIRVRCFFFGGEEISNEIVYVILKLNIPTLSCKCQYASYITV